MGKIVRLKDRVMSFTVEANGTLRSLETPAVICKAFDPANEKSPPNPKEYMAIWDTGATNSLITEKVVNECSLAQISIVEVHTASGTEMAEVYLVNIGLPNKIMMPGVRVSKGTIFGNCEVLIGMDIISRGDFALTNKDGKSMFSFRMPSMEKIDFVKQSSPKLPPKPTKSVTPKIGRNAPCHCGSGKKYKKCCGK